jgi:hypothetical protein
MIAMQKGTWSLIRIGFLEELNAWLIKPTQWVFYSEFMKALDQQLAWVFPAV